MFFSFIHTKTILIVHLTPFKLNYERKCNSQITSLWLKNTLVAKRVLPFLAK